jgi:hypothetical protein
MMLKNFSEKDTFVLLRVTSVSEFSTIGWFSALGSYWKLQR